MSKKATTQPPAAAANTGVVLRMVKEGALIGLVAVCVYLLMTLLSYDPGDPGWSRTGDNARVHNAGGPAGAWLADVFFSLFGFLAYLFPLMLGYRAWLIFRDRAQPISFDPVLLGLRVVGLILVMVAGTGLAVLHEGLGNTALPFSDGGILGASVSEAVTAAFSREGGTLLLLATFLFGLTIFVDLSWLALMDTLGHWALSAWRGMGERISQWRSKRAEHQQTAKAHKVRREVIEKRVEEQAKRVPPTIAEPIKKPQPSVRVQKERQASLFDADTPLIGELPPISLLDPADKRSDKAYSKESLEGMSRLLELKLKDFGIEIEVVAVQPGPVVTR
ncbi:MAG TPA: DNA translocase FtsK 4TM domain-containing protein, partial [Cellvibrionaceae bacterium]